MTFIVLGVLGLCMGSFVNALVWRLHHQETSKRKSGKFSIAHGRSMCPHCQHELAVKDLIPVLSWLWLGGKCRYCRRPIGWQYPLVELSTLGLYLTSYVYWPYGFDVFGIALLVTWLTLLIGLVALLVYDLRWMILPNRLVYPLYSLALAQIVVLIVQAGSLKPLVGAAGGILVTSGVFYGLFQISKGQWIGGGDVKLAVILGVFAGGFIEGVILIFIASLLGTIVSLPLVIMGKGRGKQIPFGPFLIIATIIVYLFGASIIAEYKQRFLLI